jgi:Peptidase E
MLILTSNGLSSLKIIDKLRPLLPPRSKAVLVTTASIGYKENDWNIPRLKEELSSLGISDVEYFDFDSQTPNLLSQYDVIEIIGGNPFYLLNSMKKAGCEALLKELSETKILIGVSAGALVLQNNINLIAKYSPEMNENVNLSDFTGFALTNAEILPHYSRFLSRFDRFEETAKEYEAAENRTVIRIDDGQAVFIENSRCEIL